MNQSDTSTSATHVLPGDSPVAVIGLGTMGHGIAQAFAVGGYSVRAIDERLETAATALDRIGSNLQQLADAGLLQPEQVTKVLERITVCETLEETVDGALWVTEAAWENLEVKQQLFRQIEPLVDSQTILASNSSSFPITQTTGDLKYPERAVVTHWFNPPHVIPVVEVVGGERTSDATVVTALATLESIGKTAVRIDKELSGFLVNRVQVAMFREVFDLLDRGVATASEIDRAIRGSMGLRLAALGPLAIIDHAGWDISSATYTNLVPDMRGDTEIPAVIRKLVEDGDLGTKSGQGVYEYPAETLDQTVAQRDADYLSLVRLLHTREDSA
jgi:3-hydroxybutyryl-CoA dehydrogenase